MGWFGFFGNDEEEQAELAAKEERDAAIRSLMANLTPESAQRAIAFARARPNASPGLVAKSAMFGITPDEFERLADEDPGTDLDRPLFDWDDPITSGLDALYRGVSSVGSLIYEYNIKPSVRAFMVAGDSFVSEVERAVSSVGIAAFDDVEGEGFFDEVRKTYNAWGDSAGVNYVQGLLDGRGGKVADLGTGFFAGGAAAEQTAIEQESRYRVRGEAASLGRLIADPLTRWAGDSNEDFAYDLVSGAVDFTKQVAFDPGTLVSFGTAGLARSAASGAARGARLLGASDEAAEGIARGVSRLGIEGTNARRIARQSFNTAVDGTTDAQMLGQRLTRLREAEAAGDEVAAASVRTEMAGVIDSTSRGVRGVIGAKAREFLNLRTITQQIADEPSAVALAQGWGAAGSRPLPLDMFVRLADESDPLKVAEILSEAVTQNYIPNRKFYSGARGKVKNRIANTRLAGIAPTGFITSDDMAATFGKLDSLLRQTGDEGTLLRGAADESLEVRESLLRRLAAVDPKSPLANGEVFIITRDVMRHVARSVKGVDPKAADETVDAVTRLYDDMMSEMRLYNVDEDGFPIESMMDRKTKRRDPETGEMIDDFIPGPHLLSEFNQMAIPMPDVQALRRATESNAIKRKVYESAQWDGFVRGASFFTSKVFKPFTLIRPAFIARTQLDDQMRLAAAGMDSFFSSPNQFRRALVADPDRMLDLLGNNVNDVAAARSVLQHTLADALGGGDTAKGAFSRLYKPLRNRVPKGSPPEDYPKALRQAFREELGQLANDPISREAVRLGLDSERLTKWLLGQNAVVGREAERLKARRDVLRQMDAQFDNPVVRRESFEKAKTSMRAAARTRAFEGAGIPEHLTPEFLTSATVAEGLEAGITGGNNSILSTILNPQNRERVSEEWAAFDGPFDEFLTQAPGADWHLLNEVRNVRRYLEDFDGWAAEEPMQRLLERTAPSVLRDFDNIDMASLKHSVGSEFSTVFIDGALTRFQLREMVNNLDFSGLDEDEAAAMAEELTETLTTQWALWTEAHSGAVQRENVVEDVLGDEFKGVETLRGFMHHLRDNSLLAEMTENAAPLRAADVFPKGQDDHIYRGVNIPHAVFEQMEELGRLRPGEYMDINRMSSASTQMHTASIFARNGDGVQVMFRYAADGTRGLNLSWSSSESELLLPSQRFVIDRVEELDFYETRWEEGVEVPLSRERAAAADGPEHEFDFDFADTDDDDYYAGFDPMDDMPPPDFGISGNPRKVTVYLRPVETEGVIGDVVRRGTADWMRDAMSAPPRTLDDWKSLHDWDNLPGADRDALEEVYKDIEAFRSSVEPGGVVTDELLDRLPLMQLHSGFRQLVDNAPTTHDALYMPLEEFPSSFQRMVTLAARPDREETFTELLGEAIPMRGSSLMRPKGASSEGIPKRIFTARTDGTANKVSVELPAGARALALSDETFAVPQGKLRIVGTEKRGDRLVLKTELVEQRGPKPLAGGDVGDGMGSEYLSHFIASAPADTPAKRMAGNPEMVRQYAQSVIDRIERKTGGNSAIQRLLLDDVDDIDFFDPSQNDRIEEWLVSDGRGDSMPATLKQRVTEERKNERSKWDQTVNALGDRLLSQPANKLSRGPAWQMFLTQNVSDMMPQMSREVREQAMAFAEQNLRMTDNQRSALRARYAEFKDAPDGVITDMKTVNDLAVEHAAFQVSDLLFDATNQSAFQNVMVNIFPFVDAWRESLEVYAKMLYRNPGFFMKQAARIRGAEEAGFIYNNENGERVFANPGSTFLGEWVERATDDTRTGDSKSLDLLTSGVAAAGATARSLAGDDSALAGSKATFQSQVSGLNLMFSSIGPGVGPLLQWPAGAFAPNDPKLDGINELINPYGSAFDSPEEFSDPGSWVESVAPSWGQKVLNALSEGRINEVQWNSMFSDQMQALVYTGNYDPTDPVDKTRLIEHAKRSTRWMMMLRGLTQATFLTGPTVEMSIQTDGVNEDFVRDREWDPIADPDGTWHQLGVLATEYYDLVKETGDYDTARQKFIEAYGTEPSYLAQARSVNRTGIAPTDEAEYWATERQEFFDRYPSVAGYFAPADEGEQFSYKAWLQQVSEGDRVLVTPEQQLALANSARARQIYSSTKRALESRGLKSSVVESAMFTMKGLLNQEFPGWELATGPTDRLTTPQLIQQLEVAVRDPGAENSPLQESLTQYMDARAAMLARHREREGRGNASLAGQAADPYRQVLRRYGTMLSQESPAFNAVWDLLKREVEV